MLLNCDRLVKMSILAQLDQLALPGMQKRVVVWIGAYVIVFMLFTVFVSVYSAWLGQNLLTQYSGCHLSMCSSQCCLGPRKLSQSLSPTFCYVTASLRHYRDAGI